MGVSQKLKSRLRKFLQRPGTTVDLAPLEKLLPAIEEREAELEALGDAALTEAAAGDAPPRDGGARAGSRGARRRASHGARRGRGELHRDLCRRPRGRPPR